MMNQGYLFFSFLAVLTGFCFDQNAHKGDGPVLTWYITTQKSIDRIGCEKYLRDVAWFDFSHISKKTQDIVVLTGLTGIFHQSQGVGLA